MPSTAELMPCRRCGLTDEWFSALCSHWVRGFDRAPFDNKGDGVYDRSASEETYHARPNDFIQAELTDKDAIAKAMEGIVRGPCCIVRLSVVCVVGLDTPLADVR